MTTISSSHHFRYIPPTSALTAKQILIKPNLGYPFGHPVTIDLKVLATVLKTLRERNPMAEILLVEGVCSECSLQEIALKNGLPPLLDDRTRLLDADVLPLREYPNTSGATVCFESLWAPKLI